MLVDVDGESFSVGLTYIPEPTPAGTAGALKYASAVLDPEFLLMNGDSFFGFNILDLAVRCENSEYLLGMALRREPDAGRFGSVELEGDSIIRFAEKRGHMPGFINAGVYWVRRAYR